MPEDLQDLQDLSRSERRRLKRERGKAERGLAKGNEEKKRRQKKLLAYGIFLTGIIIVAYAGLNLFPKTTPPAAVIGPAPNDHWHATYEVILCGEKQEQYPETPGGVHTHGDGQIHIHPHTPLQAGENANVRLFFFSVNGELKSDYIKLPGGKEYRNGDKCPDGKEGSVKIIVNGKEREEKEKYPIKDGDKVRIEFG
ncbi:MAG: hypothetical protein HYX24_05710 [Candidatus Aenigmarchaeota archaeon]|nr:hypothetical protein [Candidatus Aenigmarchaeota archaeon]